MRWISVAIAAIGAALGLFSFVLGASAEPNSGKDGRIVEEVRTVVLDGDVQVEIHAWLDPSRVDPSAAMDRIAPGTRQDGGVSAAFTADKRWTAADIPVGVRYNDEFDPNDADGAAGMAWAIGVWNAQAGSSMRYWHGAPTSIYTTNECQDNPTDGVNTARFSTLLDEGTPGVTCVISIPGSPGGPRRIVEFDMHFDFWTYWSMDGTPTSSEYDFNSVMLHELGHALGLGHSASPNSVMQPFLGNGEVLRTLSADDLAGLLSLYGSAAPTNTPTHTATSTQTHTATASATASASATATATSPSGSGHPFRVFAIQVAGGTSGGAPTATPTLVPTAVPTATSTATASPTSTPSPTATTAPGTVTTFGNGTFVVGVDIQPGTYRTRTAVDACYWERLSGFSGTLSDIISNDFTNTTSVVTILASDAGFRSNRCTTWTNDLSPVTPSSSSAFGDGTYIVGSSNDVAPGTWRAPGGESCYWERLGGFSGRLSDIISNDFDTTNPVVAIAAGDRGFHTHNCGVWAKIG